MEENKSDNSDPEEIVASDIEKIRYQYEMHIERCKNMRKNFLNGPRNVPYYEP